jgi:two-component sensor histidine kinase
MREIEERKAAEEKIRRTLAEKEILIKEIHHRVKNNLAMVASLINLKSSGIRDPEILLIFNELKQRIKAIHMVHDKIYHGSDITGILYSEYLEELLQDTLSGLKPTSRPVELKLESEQIMLDLDSSIPLGIAVTELASNSLKYAFKEFQADRKGEIRVTFVTEDDDYVLTYRDNGPGIPDCEKSGGGGGTLGLRLVAALSGQLGGKLSFIENGGVEIRFPKSDVS